MVYYKNVDDRRDAVVTVRLKYEHRKQLDALAVAAGLSISDLIRQWIEDASRQITRQKKGKKK
jgi:predicted transcriptional regulator